MSTFNRSRSILTLLTLAILTAFTSAQTYAACNPLTQTCPADPALGKSENINFANGASSDFTASGAPTYDQNGAAFSIARSGDSPTITSKWYIMFGHVDFVIKAAPGQGVVSSAVLLSDCLDEIDWEWLGGDDTQVQSNYFGKGQTAGYTRGAFHGAAGNHDGFNTYSIDWTAEQIAWSINGNTVRVLTAANAGSQYPQTPMQVKVGVWAGGDPANAAGTVAWAGGPISYGGGPYTMYLKAIAVTDYSTGTSYSYTGSTGNWQSIKSNGGSVSSSGTGKNTPQISNVPSVTSASGAPAPFSTDAAASSAYQTRTGYPWVTASASAVTTTDSPSDSSSSPLPVASSAPGFETKTTFNEQGFLTTITYDPATATLAPSYDSRGFLITSEPLARAVATGFEAVTDGVATASSSSSASTSVQPSTTLSATTQSTIMLSTTKQSTTMQTSTQSATGSAASSSQSTNPQAVKSESYSTKSEYLCLRAMLAFGAALLAFKL